MQTLVWRFFSMQIPDDWEMLLYSRDLPAGRCAFADRRQHRLEFHWRQVQLCPDLEGQLERYQAQLTRGQSDCRVISERQGAWVGLVTEGKAGAATSRFSRFFPGENCVVEAVFLWPKQREHLLEQQVLNSIAVAPPDAGGLRPWQAFGMRMRVAGDFALRECVAQPANARLVFAPACDPAQEERFERLGMVSHWLNGTVNEWLRRRIPAAVAVKHSAISQSAGHAVSDVAGIQSGPLLFRRGRPWPSSLAGLGQAGRPYQARAWICPADGRLYCHMTTSAAKRSEAAEPRRPGSIAGQLACCSDWQD
ncbi:MAG: hypothetical protein HYV36_06685 [Lentisphaerae bacterium]|nr:hypothetical protein [Lentisphaerota bacterium]